MIITGDFFILGSVLLIYSIIALVIASRFYEWGFDRDALIGVFIAFLIPFVGFLLFMILEEDEDGNIIIGNPKQSEEVEQEEEDIRSNATEHILEDGSKILIIEDEDGKQEVIEVPK